MFLMALGFSALTHAGPTQPTRSSGNNLPRAAATETAPTGETRFLSFRGKLVSAQDSLLEQLEIAFTQPLYDSGGHLLFSYVAQTMGDGEFFLDLIVEPASADDIALARAFVAEREQKGFRGLSVRFQRVVAIFEVAHLEAGLYIDGQDDPFRQDYELARSFAFMSLRSWRDFSNDYGFALLSHDEAKLMTFLEGFVADEVELAHLKSDVLPKANMLAIEPKPYLILENDASVGPGFDESPFLPFKSFRNCYSPKFENGMCVKN